MSSASIHDKLGRVRPPRVQIRYDVHVGDAWVKKELPFVVGVMGDFSGNPTEQLKSLRDRKFVDISRDNFNEVMKRMTPGLNFRIENTLADDGSEMAVQLKFGSIDDFEPAQVAKQVTPVQKLLETRNKLQDLLAKIDRSEELEGILEQVLQNTDDLKKFASELGVNDSGAGDQNDEPTSEGE